jgi:hypothetical protein
VRFDLALPVEREDADRIGSARSLSFSTAAAAWAAVSPSEIEITTCVSAITPS